MQQYQDHVTDQYGNAKSGSSVLVKTAAGATATIYSDDGVTTKVNPITTGSNGAIEFYAANGTYVLNIDGIDSTRFTLLDVTEADTATPLSSSTVVGETGGVVKRFNQNELGPVVSVFRYLSDSELADVVAGAALVDVTAGIQAAVTAVATSGASLFFPAGRYLISNAITLPANVTLYGETSGSAKTKRTIIKHTGAAQAFKTDKTVSAFDGLTIRDFRIIEGVSGQWAIESHYPYTTIEGVFVENMSGDYAGNGIRLHNDGGQASMGAWNSRLRGCRVVLKDDSVNPRTCYQYEINGGDVVSENCQAIKAEKGFYVVKGEIITFRECGTNQIRDRTSVAGTPVNAAFVIGDGTQSVLKAVIEKSYIEAHTRAVLIRSGAVNTSIRDNYVDDTGYHDPGWAANTQGEIEFESGADGLVVDGNRFRINNQSKSFVRATVAANKLGWSSANNIYFLARGAAAYVGNYFDGALPVERLNDRQEAEVSGVTTHTAWGVLANKGISFPATAVASSDANTLDDYEEGNWTPALTFATAGNLSVTYNFREGRYTKIGRIVTVIFDVDAAPVTHTTAASYLQLTGLPFAVTSWEAYGAAVWQGVTKANYTDINPQALRNETALYFMASGSAQNISYVVAADVPTGGSVKLKGSITYIA